jgi:HAD superfamily hydrolase (TIGR01459 family)
MAETDPARIPILSGLSAVAGRYDGYILDLWGVLHNGVRPYPSVLDALSRLRASGRRVVILSNGPRRADAVIRRTMEIGIARALYDGLHSSGEETWRMLHDRREPAYAGLGRRALPLMPQRDRGLLEGLDLELVAEPVAADFLLVTGLAGRTESVADYESVLSAGARLGRPMVCANPDLEVVHDGVREWCAGALAARYEALGGRVLYNGKPYPSVYRTCLSLLAGVDRRRILAVGDSLRTDVAGAARSGLDSLLVTGGIHAEELAGAGGLHPDPARLVAACAGAGVRPTYAIPAFTW